MTERRKKPIDLSSDSEILELSSDSDGEANRPAAAAGPPPGQFEELSESSGDLSSGEKQNRRENDELDAEENRMAEESAEQLAAQYEDDSEDAAEDDIARRQRQLRRVRKFVSAAAAEAGDDDEDSVVESDDDEAQPRQKEHLSEQKQREEAAEEAAAAAAAKERAKKVTNTDRAQIKRDVELTLKNSDGAIGKLFREMKLSVDEFDVWINEAHNKGDIGDMLFEEWENIVARARARTGVQGGGGVSAVEADRRNSIFNIVNGLIDDLIDKPDEEAYNYLETQVPAEQMPAIKKEFHEQASLYRERFVRTLNGGELQELSENPVPGWRSAARDEMLRRQRGGAHLPMTRLTLSAKARARNEAAMNERSRILRGAASVRAERSKKMLELQHSMEGMGIRKLAELTQHRDPDVSAMAKKELDTRVADARRAGRTLRKGRRGPIQESDSE